MAWGRGWKPYVPVAMRRARAMMKMQKLRKTGRDIQPVTIEGRQIAQTFWGKAWCDHLESFSDYANRLPRGRSYVRNGSVCHLDIAPGQVKAMVSGSELYNVAITIKTLPKHQWIEMKSRCAGQIGSLLELLQGRLSKSVMAVVADRDQGLFPLPREISFSCDCPDWAIMCKHVAAVLYGVGARLDVEPAVLFRLRGVDHEELISADADAVMTATDGKGRGRRRIVEGDLKDVFGIEMAAEEASDNGRSWRKKDAASRKAGAKKASRAALDVRSPTDQTVRALRAKFDMAQGQFARLLGVSVSSVNNWEKKKGRINLQTRTLETLNHVARLTKRKAWKRLDLLLETRR